jgi:hypothetical protein
VPLLTYLLMVELALVLELSGLLVALLVRLTMAFLVRRFTLVLVVRLVLMSSTLEAHVVVVLVVCRDRVGLRCRIVVPMGAQVLRVDMETIAMMVYMEVVDLGMAHPVVIRVGGVRGGEGERVKDRWRLTKGDDKSEETR